MNQTNEYSMNFPRDLAITLNLGPKKFALRFPSNAELLQRSKSRKIVQNDIGRGQSTTDIVGGDDADLAIARAIILDRDGDGFAKAEDLSISEASMLLNTITSFLITNVENIGGGCEVTARLVNDVEMRYSVATPTSEQVMHYRRAFAKSVDLPHGRSEIRTNLSIGGDVFDACTPVEYRDIPLIFKTALISAVIAQFESLVAKVSFEKLNP